MELRDELGLTGTKFGCGIAACGACTVHLDGAPVRSCTTPVSAVGTKRVTTIEALAQNGTDHPVQRAWQELNVPQCGYCQAGQLMSAAALIDRNPSPNDAEIEPSVESGQIKVHRVVAAADCGPVLNPNGGRAQLEGGVVQALSAALHERITIDAGGVVQGNFYTYRLLRISEAPLVIESYFVDRPDVHPTGLGEPSVPPLAPALANALYRATGTRYRSLPLAPFVASQTRTA